MTTIFKRPTMDMDIELRNLWLKSIKQGAKTIINKWFHGTQELNKFELKFILPYWGLIGIDFGFFNLSNVSIDRLKVPKYPFKASNKRSDFTHKFF